MVITRGHERVWLQPAPKGGSPKTLWDLGPKNGSGNPSSIHQPAPTHGCYRLVPVRELKRPQE